jgi:hypothetical protein
MSFADRPARLAVDDLTFTQTKGELRVTALPWGELSLDLDVEGIGDGWCRNFRASLEDVRVRGRTRFDIDDLVLEAAQGWVPDPDAPFPRAVIEPYQLYVDDHFALIDNRVTLHRIDDDHVRVTWAARTEVHINHYCRRDLHSEMALDATVRVSDGEFRRLRWWGTHGLDQKAASLTDAPHRLVDAWLEQRGRVLGQQGWFEGRAFQRIDIHVVFGTHLATEARQRRMQIRSDRLLRIHIEAPIAALRTHSAGDVAALLQREIELSLVAAAAAYPAGPSFLR